jgi:rhodanese-related sulfurtransferase
MKAMHSPAALGMSFAATFAALAVSPSELAVRLKDRSVTVVDVRPTDVYRVAHIPGAINVPYGVIREKMLPPLGAVVVCDGGLGLDRTRESVAVLNQKPGIKAEALEGGFAGWETAFPASSTRAPGQGKETFQMITYKELKAMPGEQLLLVDLRREPTSAKSSKRVDTAKLSAPLTDLAAAFPGAEIIRSPFEGGRVAKRQAGGGPLMVLVDNGDDRARDIARQLRSTGERRCVILAGGELILARDGQPGLQRLGTGVTTSENPNPPASGGAK